MKIRINTHGNPLPESHNGNWYDLCTDRDYVLDKEQYAQLSLGISLEIPEGYAAYVVPRSSTFKKYGILLANSFGVIDSSYRGDGDIISFPAYATRNVFLPKGTRIAQMTVMPTLSLEFESVPSLDNEDRGGIGSTGD